MLLAPFRGLVFDHGLDQATVTCPPYDVIDQPAVYRERSLYNLAHLLLPENGSQQKAAHTLDSWIAAGVLREEPGEQFYLLHMSYQDATGTPREARGIIGALTLDDQVVVGHEETIPSTRQDRLDLLRSTEANLDLIIALSSASELEPTLEERASPRTTFTADRITHRIYDVIDRDQIEAITTAIDQGAMAIADGHHRYTVASQYAESRRRVDGSGPWDRIMAFIAPATGSGMTVGAIHRLLPEVDPDWDDIALGFDRFEAEPVPPTEPGELVLVLGQAHGGGVARLVPRAPIIAELPAPWRLASAAVARERLWPMLLVDESSARYHSSPGQMLGQLTDHPRGAVVLLAPVPEVAIAAAAEVGIRFPQKSTYFFPKPPAGMVLRRLTR